VKGYLPDCKNVPAGLMAVTGPISYVSMEIPLGYLSDDNSNDGTINFIIVYKRAYKLYMNFSKLSFMKWIVCINLQLVCHSIR
jgi:hypothetical protein